MTTCMLDMYMTPKLEKHDSQKPLPDVNFLSEDGATLSHEEVFYSLHRKIDLRGVANSWAELYLIKDRSHFAAPTVQIQFWIYFHFVRSY